MQEVLPHLQFSPRLLSVPWDGLWPDLTSPTFLISPLLAVWKLVPSDHFTSLQRGKFSRESETRMCFTPLQPQPTINHLQTHVSQRMQGGHVWERKFLHFIKEGL